MWRVLTDTEIPRQAGRAQVWWRPEAVIPGRVKDANPESGDCGARFPARADARPGMTLADNWARRDLNGSVERDNQTELSYLPPGSKDRFPWRATRLL